MRNLGNFVSFQAGWLACVWLAASGRPLAGAAAALVAAGLNFLSAGARRRELVLFATAAAIGVVFDSLVAASGYLAYLSGVVAPLPAPPWDIALWVLFASTLGSSLGWLQGRAVLAALFGAVGGPLAYLAAARLGAVSFVEPWRACLLLGAGWAMLTPLLLLAAAPPARTAVAASGAADTPHV